MRQRRQKAGLRLGEFSMHGQQRYDFDVAGRAVQSGAADLIAFGRAFISNLDLAERLRTGLQPVGQATGYGAVPRGPRTIQP